MDTEQELKEKIRNAREKMAEQEVEVESPVEEVVEEEPQEVEVEDEEQEESQDADEDTEENEEEDDLEVDSEDYKKLDSKGKKFAHMRKKEKEQARENQELRERLARLEGAQEAIKHPEPKEVAVEIPDKEYEPEAYMEHMLAESDRKLEVVMKKFEASEAKAATTQRERDYKDLEGGYAAKDKSYMDAKSFFQKAQASDLMDAYPRATDAEIQQELKRREYTLVQNLAKAGSSADEIFSTIKAQAVAKGYQDIAPVKKDNKKLKRNLKKAASLNDAPSGDSDTGYSESQLARMKTSDFHKLGNNPKNMKRAALALKAARIKALG